MQKVIIEKSGGYKVLEVKEFSDFTTREVLENQVLVEIKYFGINMADIFVRLGLYAKAKEIGYPMTPDFEFSGIIKAVGKDVIGFEIGGRVVGINLFGCYATEIVLESGQVCKVPDMIGLDVACALPVNYMTAIKILGKNLSYKNILIQSGMGGVGQALINLSIQDDVDILSVVSSVAKEKKCIEKFGFYKKISVINIKKYFEQQKNFDLIAHSYGGKFMKQDLNFLEQGGNLVVFGFSSFLKTNKIGKLPLFYYLYAAWNYLKMPKVNVFTQLVSQNKNVSGINLAFSFNEDKKLFQENMKKVFNILILSKLVLPEIKVFDLVDVREAHEYLENRENYGKIVIRI